MRKLAIMLAAAALCAACGADNAPRTSTTALTDNATPDDLADEVARLMPQLERLSGLDRTDVLRVRRQDRAAARAYVAQRLEEELPPTELEGVRRTYVALGLIPDTLDLHALMLDLYTEQVLGYYDPKSKTLYVIEGANMAALRTVLVHELVHALQDQHVDLDSLVARERGNDRQIAAHAAVEGHAMLVMFAAVAEQQSRRQIDPGTLPNPADELGPALTEQNAQFPVFARTPLIIRESLLFPYLRGVDFVHRLWASRQPRARYPAPLDSLLPQSTEQVLRPADRFISTRDEPVDLRIDSIPAGWRVIRDNNFGQLETALFLEQHLGAVARGMADGWDGDRYVLLQQDDHDVLFWVSAWDTAEEADGFARGVRVAGTRRPGRAVTVARFQLATGQAAVRITDAPVGAPPVPALRVH